MRFAIVDDFPEDSQRLAQELGRQSQLLRLDVEIQEYSGGEGFLSGLAPGKFDLVFLDIYLGGINGMETARRLREVDPGCLLVFTSSSPEFGVDSYRVRAFDYLLKPVQPEQLAQLLELCMEVWRREEPCLEVKEGRSLIQVPRREILYADVQGHYFCVHTTARILRSRIRFQELEDQLKEDPAFLVCYRNILVNLNQVMSIEGPDFLLSSGERVPIQKKLFAEVKQAFANYLFRNTRERRGPLHE